MKIKALFLSFALLALAAPALSQTMPSGGGGNGSGVVSSFSGGTTGLTPSSPTTGDIVLSGTLTPTNGGTGINALGTGVATALGQNVSGTGAICLASGSACGGGSGTVTSITAGNGINLSTNPCIATCTASTTLTLNNQTGTTYALASGDGGKLVTASNASAQAYSIVQANTAGFTSGYGTTVSNIGAGTVTITAATSVFGNGLTTLVVAPGQVADIGSNGTDYPFTAMSLPKMAADTILGNFSATANYPIAGAVPACAADGSHGLTFASHALACTSITAGTGTVNAGTTPGVAYYATTSSAVSDGSAALVALGGFNVTSGSAGVTNGMQLVTANHPGLYASSTNLVDMSSAGGFVFKKQLSDTTSGSWVLVQGAASSATVAVIRPNNTNAAGLGGAAGVPAMVVGSATIENWASTGPAIAVLPTDATHTDATLCRDTTSGAVLTGTGTIGICLGTSTMRAKENIRDVTDSEALLKLRPVSFNYRKGWGYPSDKQYYGFLAEDVKKVLPKLVGVNAKGQTLNADYVGMIPLMVRQMQKQEAEITSLRAQLASRR